MPLWGLSNIIGGLEALSSSQVLQVNEIACLGASQELSLKSFTTTFQHIGGLNANTTYCTRNLDS